VTRARLEPDGSIVEILPAGGTRSIRPRIDWPVVDATSEADIARHQREDLIEAMHDAAVWTRAVRRSVGLSQADFSRCIGVPVAKVRDWESGRQAPEGLERTVLRLIAHSPKSVMAVLTG
jgi:putative transcriptional regulator